VCVDAGIRPKLNIYELHTRHMMAQQITDGFTLNAAVCLDRYNASPAVCPVRRDGEAPARYDLRWDTPTEVEKRSCANDEDAARDGAYGMALAAAEVHLEMVGYGRTKTKTGADLVLVSQSKVPLREALTEEEYFHLEKHRLRLEVSGILRGSDATMNKRLEQKVRQVERGRSTLRGLACVVRFDSLAVAFEMAVV
jgi:hypothetical protein